MQKREPVEGGKDDEVLALIRRANLDAFWDRSSKTVESHWRDVKRMDAIAGDLGLSPIQEKLGPWPQEDSFGMRMAVIMLRRSLDLGRNKAVVQYDTVRKLRACATNIYQAGPDGLTDRIAAFERSRLWITSIPSQSYWFHRFISGFHKRVGELKRQDEPLLIETLQDLQDLWEEEWETVVEPAGKLNLAVLASWFLVGFTCGLRGEEIMLIETAGTFKTLEERMSVPVLHFEVVVSGKMKGNQVRGRKFSIPCAERTEKSGLEPGKWMQCLREMRLGQGINVQMLFQNEEGSLRLNDYKQMFLGMLEIGQARGVRGIKANTQVAEDYGILRSLQRGVTTHAQNVGVKVEVVNAVNRWRKHASSRTGAPRLDMIEVYSQLEAVKPFVLQFSRSL